MQQIFPPTSIVCVCVSDCVAKWLKHLTVNRKITGSSPTSYHWRKIFLHLAPNPGPSKIVNWGPGLGRGRARPLAVPNSTEVQVRLWVPTPQCRGIVSAPASVWLGLASGVCLVLGPEFPEVPHTWSKQAVGVLFGPATFSQTKRAHAHFEYT